MKQNSIDNGNVETLFTQCGDIEFRMVMNTGEFFSVTLSGDYHVHPYYELIAVNEGHIDIGTNDGGFVRITKGGLGIIPPNFRHNTMSDADCHRMTVMRFSYRQIKGNDELFKLADGLFSSVRSVQRIDGASRAVDIIVRTVHEMSRKAIGYKVAVNALMQTLYIELIRLYHKAGEPEVVPAFVPMDNNNIRYYITDRWFSDNYDRNVTENDIAVALGLSKRQVSRILSDIYGMSFHELLVEYRLSRAVTLITEGNCTLETVAHSVGYASLSGFCRVFKKRFGMTVGEYRCAHDCEGCEGNCTNGTS